MAALLLAGAAGLEAQSPGPALLPARVKRIVLHTLGGPFYRDPARRWVFEDPARTYARWRHARFGAHWIVWTDGSLWPRHPRPGEPASAEPPPGPADAVWHARLARDAAPVYFHAYGANADSVGIEVAHSGRRTDPLPEPQGRSLAWLVAALLEMSGGRLTTADVVGHKDLDRRPAWVNEGCRRAGCAFYADGAGRPYRRRVDPPEALFATLRRHGLAVPREGNEGDRELSRAEALPPDRRPAEGR